MLTLLLFSLLYYVNIEMYININNETMKGIIIGCMIILFIFMTCGILSIIFMEKLKENNHEQ